MLSKRPFHPLLFALFPALSLYSLNTALVPASDVPFPLLLVLGSTCVVWAILSLVLRSVERGAAGASLAVVLCFAYGHIWNLTQQNPTLKRTFEVRSDMFWYWFPFLVIGVTLGCWKWKRFSAITGGLNVGGIILAGFPAVSIATSWFNAWRGTQILEASSHSLKLQVTNRPDIYYVILDGFGRTDSLKRVIGYDDSTFISGLQDRGFFVAEDGRSNYCQTELSLSSSLNLDYLPNLLPGMKKTWDDRQVLDHLIDKNQVSKYLKKIGYRYEAFTTGFPSVRPYSADLWVDSIRSLSFYSGVLLQELPSPAENDTVTISQFEDRRLMVEGALNNLAKSAPGGTQPRFIFAHILAPHPPFVFGPSGEPIRPYKMGFSFVDGSDYFENGGSPKQYKTGYADQATYLTKRVLETIDQILKRSAKPPIIIFQGDHGSKLKLNQQLLEKTDVNECFPNLNALYVPPEVRSNLYPGMTPVNSFRMIFNGLFHDTFDRLPDKSYYSGWLTPFDFIDVTSRIKSQGVSPSPATKPDAGTQLSMKASSSRPGGS